MADRRRPQRQAATAARIQIILNALANATNRGTPLNLSSAISFDDFHTFMTSTADDPDDEDDDSEDYHYRNGYRSSPWIPPATEPQKAGVELLNSGDFGCVRDRLKEPMRNINLGRLLTDRLCRPYPKLFKEDYARNLIPNCNGTAVAFYGANIYTAQFSKDSSFYYTCSQDFRLHIYDTTAPPSSSVTQPEPGLQTVMPVKRSIQARPGRWTITDANLSLDNERMVYSSIGPTAYMTSAVDPDPVQVPIPFSDPQTSRNGWGRPAEYFGLYSCRFSADGSEVVASGNGSGSGIHGRIYVYDLLANRRTVKIDAHGDDVNSCTWADTASGNVLVSASDDTFLKVWDRRSLGASGKPSGVLIGHTEGITYVSAKGDGRYVISNGKDQTVRLWDLRKMRTSAEYEEVEGQNYGSHFDYRYPPYPRPKYSAHPLDCSVMTYRGHSVLRTLIRCHFSPAETTGARYIYSGSADGRIHIWSLDGRVVQVLDADSTLPMTADPSAPEEPSRHGRRGYDRVCVRDLSWHSQEPYLMSAGWSDEDGSIVARHEWKGLGKMSGSLEDWIEKNKQQQREMQWMPGSFEPEETEEDEDEEDV